MALWGCPGILSSAGMAECTTARGSRRLRLIMGTGGAKLSGALCVGAKALMQKGHLEEITPGQRFQGPLGLYPVPSHSHYWQPVWMAERNLSCKTWEDCCAIVTSLMWHLPLETGWRTLALGSGCPVWSPVWIKGCADGEGRLVLQCWTSLPVRKLIEFITFFKDEGENRNHEWNPTQHHK